jgi:hypothetical protein
MGRYNNVKVKDENGKKSLKTTYYDEIPEKNDDIYVQTTDGDRFDLLAFKYYGNPGLWWFIAKANKMKYMNIEPGKIIRIPSSTQSAHGE